MKTLAMLLWFSSPLFAQVTIKGIDDKGHEAKYETPKIDYIEKSSKGLFIGFKEGSKLQKINCLNVVEMKFQDEKPVSSPGHEYFQIKLTTGDLLFGSIIGIVNDELSITSSAFGVLKYDITQIKSIESVVNRNLWTDPEPVMPAGHVIGYIMPNNKTDFEKASLIKDFTKEKVLYVTAVGSKETSKNIKDITRIYIMHFAFVTPPALPKDLYASLVLTDGTRLTGTIEKLDGDFMVIKDFYERKTEQTIKINIAHLSAIHFKNSRVVFLSDITPTAVNEDPNFIKGSPETDLYYPYQRDRAVVGGGPLTIRDKVYSKGLGVHARSELTYDLGGSYKKFMATIGIDNSDAKVKDWYFANVTFKVLVDGKVAKEWKNITIKDNPLDIELDITAAKSLTLLVEFGENGFVLDRANWAMARLVK